jgi:alkylation response protein AidB-like acyl-CoA dehydrogenase
VERADWLRNPVGLGAVSAALAAYGTDEQRQEWLPGIRTGDDVWCQLWTEPDAGSDLAAIATTAVRSPAGTAWLVSGRKAFTTLAHVARWGILLARTGPAGSPERHRGLTCFVLDMRAPGVDVRPLRLLDGDADVNEVVLSNVEVPDAQRIGDVGVGWDVAMTTLDHERLALSGPPRPRGGGPIAEAIRLWNEHSDRDPVMADRLAQLWVESEVARLTVARLRQDQSQSQSHGDDGPGARGALAKLLVTEVDQRVWALCVELLGPAGALYDTWEPHRPAAAGESGRDVRRAYLRSRAATIQGGTAEVLRTVVAERVLGMPSEPRSGVQERLEGSHVEAGDGP